MSDMKMETKMESTVYPVLQVQDLKVYYHTSKGAVHAIDGISFDLAVGETLGLVGESGCGKTTVGLSLLNMPSPPGKIEAGSITINGVNILNLSDSDLRRNIRWSEIAMVFQGAMNCLTPVYTIRKLLFETYRVHMETDRLNPKEAEDRMKKYIALVGLPEHVLGQYPHELSGGMKQRIVIAMALFLEPKVVILDEPTTALDVIVQAQILNLIKRLKNDLKLSYVFITHDLATEAEIADRIMVMYAGKIIEIAGNEAVFCCREPLHPYTERLLGATPRLRSKVSELAFIEGAPPDLIDPPAACRFAPRCAFARKKCREQEPPIREIWPNHMVACWKVMEDQEYASA